jgi:hypothetical protein
MVKGMLLLNSLDFILGLNMRSNPGADFNYNDSDSQIISAMFWNRRNR